MATYIFAAPDSSAADRAAASPGCLYNGSAWTAEQKNLFLTSGNVIELRPGTYEYEGLLEVGSNVTVRGSGAISMPTDRKSVIVADPSRFAVFSSKTVRNSDVEVRDGYHARLYTSDGASNITIENLYLAGYAHLKIRNASNITVRHTVVHNYHGTYPTGKWANMGYYDATGAFWVQGNSSNVLIEHCAAQFSSHHGFCIHYPDSATAHHITFDDCRAITCGCGMLKGDKASNIAESEAVPELRSRAGCGYMDWSVGFDLNESIKTHHVVARNCYAYDCWKAGFYQEPGKTTYDHLLVNCVSVSNGQRAMLASGMMIPRESEHSNYYLQTARMEGCVSLNARKAGYLLNPEQNHCPVADQARLAYEGKYYRVLMLNCIDCGSLYGVIVGPGAAADVRMDNCAFANNARRAMNLFGAGPITVRSVKIRSENPTRPPILLGRYCRANKALSLSSSHRSTFAEGLTLTKAMTGVEISGTVEGLQAGTAIAELKSGSSVNKDTSYPFGGVILSTATTPFDISICEGTGGGGGGDEPEPDSPVAASFTVSPSSGSAPLTVTFRDTSTGDPISWEWSFGDGAAATEPHPVHTYTTPGTYPVSLTVRDAVSEDTETRQNAVDVRAGTGEPPTGATRFVLSNLQVSPSVVRPGERVVISFRVSEGER